MENIALAVKELGAKIGFDIALDEDGACALELADGRTFFLQERANLDELDFVALLGVVPEDARADVFKELLSANFYWQETLGATLSWNPDLEQVALIYPFPLADATSSTLENIFTRFLELQAAWKDHLEELVAEARYPATDAEAADEADGEPDGGEDLIINP